MEEEIKELQKRLRAVEKNIYMGIGGAVVLAACSLAFLGIEYWRIPKAVDSAISVSIGAETLERIRVANERASTFLTNSSGVVCYNDIVTLRSKQYHDLIMASKAPTNNIAPLQIEKPTANASPSDIQKWLIEKVDSKK